MPSVTCDVPSKFLVYYDGKIFEQGKLQLTVAKMLQHNESQNTLLQVVQPYTEKGGTFKH